MNPLRDSQLYPIDGGRPINPSKSRRCVDRGKGRWVAIPLLLLGVDLILNAPGALFVLVLGLTTLALWPQYQHLKHQWRWIAQLTIGGTVTCLTTVWLASCVEPAQAQFFQNAQNFFESSFGSATNAIPIVFNSIRALYILYLAVSFVSVINSVRQDEDWQTVARTPALVVVVVTLADILTGVITG